jgi:hypothetical protein
VVLTVFSLLSSVWRSGWKNWNQCLLPTMQMTMKNHRNSRSSSFTKSEDKRSLPVTIKTSYEIIKFSILSLNEAFLFFQNLR